MNTAKRVEQVKLNIKSNPISGPSLAGIDADHPDSASEMMARAIVSYEKSEGIKFSDEEAASKAGEVAVLVLTLNDCFYAQVIRDYRSRAAPKMGGHYVGSGRDRGEGPGDDRVKHLLSFIREEGRSNASLSKIRAGHLAEASSMVVRSIIRCADEENIPLSELDVDLAAEIVAEAIVKLKDPRLAAIFKDYCSPTVPLVKAWPQDKVQDTKHYSSSMRTAKLAFARCRKLIRQLRRFRNRFR